MYPSLSILFPALTILNWSVTAIYASVNPRLPITPRDLDMNKRQIHNADYGAAASAPPKPGPESWDSTSTGTGTSTASPPDDAAKGSVRTQRSIRNHRRHFHGLFDLPVFVEAQLPDFVPTLLPRSDDENFLEDVGDDLGRLPRTQTLSLIARGLPANTPGSNEVQFDQGRIPLGKKIDGRWWRKRQEDILHNRDIARAPEENQYGHIRSVMKHDLPTPEFLETQAGDVKERTHRISGRRPRWTRRGKSAMDAFDKLSRPVISD